MPGPADYPPPVPPKPSGGKFNMSKPKSDIDWIITRASQMPGPGDTDPGPSPKGACVLACVCAAKRAC
jgi:hypothetical protein